MLIRDVMSRKPEFMSSTTSLKKAAAEMQKLDCGFIPIGDNDRLIGVITDRDMAIRGVASGKDPDKTTVKEIMTDKVLYCFEDDDVKKAADSMSKQQIRRLIVLNKEKRMTGIVSLGDIARKCSDENMCGRTFTAIEKEARH